jgi:hypothetical protein
MLSFVRIHCSVVLGRILVVMWYDFQILQGDFKRLVYAPRALFSKLVIPDPISRPSFGIFHCAIRVIGRGL